MSNQPSQQSQIDSPTTEEVSKETEQQTTEDLVVVDNFDDMSLKITRRSSHFIDQITKQFKNSSDNKL